MLTAAFYKGTRPGIAGIYNRGVRLWTHGDYSHCEVIFSDGLAASASFSDGGVRFKKIDFEAERWDFVPLPARMEAAARAWFEENNGKKYDVLGNVHFVIGPVSDDKQKYCCSEAMAAALGFTEAWRFHPNSLRPAVMKMALEAR